MIAASSVLVNTQWVLLLALGVLVIVMYRQLAYLMRLVGGNSAQEGLAVGESAPKFEYLDLRNESAKPQQFVPGGSVTLLMFADPGCNACEKALVALDRAAHGAPHLQVIVATEAPAEVIEQFDAFAQTPLRLVQVAHDVSRRIYRVAATPFVFVLSHTGQVVAKGAAHTTGEIRRMLKPVEAGVTSGLQSPNGHGAHRGDGEKGGGSGGKASEFSR